VKKIKADPLLHSEYLMNERQRWKKRKDDGKTPPSVHNMNEREARRKRRYWRAAQEKCRIQTKASQQQSPPATPVPGSSQSQRGRKKVACVRSKCYKDLQKLTVKLRCMERKKEKYRKKLERVLAANSRTDKDTPRKHVKKMLSGCQVSDTVAAQCDYENNQTQVCCQQREEQALYTEHIFHTVFVKVQTG